MEIRGVRPETWETPPPENPFLAPVRARPLIELELRDVDAIVDQRLPDAAPEEGTR